MSEWISFDEWARLSRDARRIVSFECGMLTRALRRAAPELP